MKLNLNILDEVRIDLLHDICDKIDISDFYMAGGTALSLQMGLRESHDFDFFTQAHFNPDELYKELQNAFPEQIEQINITKGTCDVRINDVQVSFFEYHYPMVGEFVKNNDFDNLKLASIEDIAVMKLSSIGSRGAKRDFFDLYQILTSTDLTPKDLINNFRQKVGENFDFSYIIAGITYFNDAEKDEIPNTFVNYDWDDIKEYFQKIKEEIAEYVYDEIDYVDVDNDNIEYNADDDYDADYGAID